MSGTPAENRLEDLRSLFDLAFRIGQSRNVFVHRLICSGIFEERIDEMLKAKRELARMSVAEGESWLSELDDKSLAELFSR
jgi:SNF2 family DNA or RNA helicase